MPSVKEALKSIYDAVQLHPKRKPLTKLGQEVPDPTPIEPPLGYVKQPSISDQIRQMVRSEQLRQEARNAGFETLEEADDFDVDDEFHDPTTPYEEHFFPQEEPPAPTPSPYVTTNTGPTPPPVASPGAAPQPPQAPPAPSGSSSDPK